MSHPSTHGLPQDRLFKFVCAGVFLFWLVAVFAHLYFFAYAAMDSWCYAGPAALARIPFALTTPFLGTFEGADKAWGLHWPGGPLLTSIVTPLLPHNPATYVLIFIGYWLALSLAAGALVRKLTGSGWLGLAAFIFIASDRVCFSVNWLERYELLSGAIAIAAILALSNGQDQRSGVRSLVIGVTFFLLPLLHPVFSGLGMMWVIYLGFRTLVLKTSWRPFWIAAIGYATGWAAFLGYYLSRPWLYAEFRSHARENVEITRQSAPPGIHTFLLHLFETDRPTRAGAVIYVIAIGGALWMLFGFVNSRRGWRQFISREDTGIFATIGFVSTLVLSQASYNTIYWATSWPFAVVVACMVAHWIFQKTPGRRPLVTGALIVLLLLHGSYLAGRTFLWYKAGFVNMRARIAAFAAALPQGGQVFIPEALWDTYAGGTRKVYMNTLPYLAGDAAEKRYAAYITPLIQPGDVLIIDQLQSHTPLIDPHQPGWKEIAHCNVTYKGEDHPHGFDLTAYQKE